MTFERQFFTLHYLQYNYMWRCWLWIYAKDLPNLGRTKKKFYIWRRQRETCLRKKQRRFCVKQGHTSACFLSFKILDTFRRFFSFSGDSFNFTFFFGGIFYQMYWANIFPYVFIKFSTRISNFSVHRPDN